MHTRLPQHLPVFKVLPDLERALAEAGAAILEAPPGAGKSTGVPLALLDAPWLGDGRIVMLEPRRLAARAVATRMAGTLDEAVGDTVGYRTRLESRTGPSTRIEVVTEGILTRRLQRDPALEDVGLLIFDEFHERNLVADLGLALALDARAQLRPDLRILVMSATLDGERVAELLGDAPRIRAPGLAFPVEVHHMRGMSPGTRERARDAPRLSIPLVRAAVVRALAEQEGDALVFLPGSGEIRRLAAELEQAHVSADVDVLPLYGDLPPAAQDRAVRPAPAGRRKVVLATNIAETSLTIEGVRAVVDTGLERRPRFDPRSGLDALLTVRISAASAEQRRGRAGRTAPGRCYRLWSEADQRGLQPHATPEILEADLASLALELAAWGATDANELAWLDPPPAGALTQARALLRSLGALDADGRITSHGRALESLGVHPRLAELMLAAKEAGIGHTGCMLAALLGERDLLPRDAGDSDIRSRLERLRGAVDANRGRGPEARIRRSASLHARRLGVEPGDVDVTAAGRLLAAAWPDRVARARPGSPGRYRLAGGRGAAFAEPEALARSEYLVVPVLDARSAEARIRLAAPLGLDELLDQLADRIETVDRVGWDATEEAVLAQREQRLGELSLSESPLERPDDKAMRAAVCGGVRMLGLGSLPWTAEAGQWRARIAFARRLEGAEAWPDTSDEALLGALEAWLGPWLAGISRRSQFGRLDLARALEGWLPWPRKQRLDVLAPARITLPGGARFAVDYEGEDGPSLSVWLQQVFGMTETPRVGDGRVPLLMKLLSPAGRPVQITRDLGGFWSGSYREVRREMKGRYPKHDWPEDPALARPPQQRRERASQPGNRSRNMK